MGAWGRGPVPSERNGVIASHNPGEAIPFSVIPGNDPESSLCILYKGDGFHHPFVTHY